MSVTSAAIISAVLAFVITAVLGRVLIPALHKLKFGQNIIEDFGPKWHAKKQGTPTMGGLMFIIGIIVASVLTVLICSLSGNSAFSQSSILGSRQAVKFIASILLAFGFSLIGFTDDYIKVAKKRNLGLTEIQKTIPQLAVTAAYLLTLMLSDNTRMAIPGYGYVALDSIPGKIFFCIFGLCVIYGTVNAVNFTDGLDGLCAGVTLPVGVAFAVMAALCHLTSISVLGAALAGGCAGYLIWNRYPAKVMMGDTGSMFLGGLVVALAYAIECPLILIPVGIIYVIEALSDVIQIGSIKLRHKKVFKMAPIHHHFEMCGWSERKIDTVFAVISTIGCAIGVLIVYFTVK